jgi:CubicO group peptidase (beta-lactamase class C family)
MRVAGACAEVAAGKKWRELFDDAIGKPVGMSSTRWGRLELSQNPSPAGGASSTLRDYGRFLAMVLGRGEVDGVRVLSEAGVAELLRDQTGGVPIGRASVGRRGGDGKASYGVGCWVEGKDEQGETVTASSPGAFGFVPAVNMERGVGFIWMIEDKGRNRKKAKDLPDMVKVIRETIKAQLGTEMGTTPASPDPE